MNEIHSLISDAALDIDLLKNLKNREIEQKFLYVSDEAVALYYAKPGISRPYFKDSFKEDDFKNFFLKYFGKKGEKIALFSLGCGNAATDKKILEGALKKGVDVSYVAVDSSKQMLGLANSNLKDIKINQKFVCADFGDFNFKSEIKYLITEKEKKVFSLFGQTVGNILPTNIADTLNNLLGHGDYLWFTAALREGTGKEDDFNVFKNYLNYLSQPKMVGFMLNPLVRMGVPKKAGKITLEMYEEQAVGALNFVFKYVFSKKTTVDFRGEKIIFLPDEQIKLLNIRVYLEKKIISYFNSHNFKLVACERKGNRGQFLFKKK
jgi:hypothetical protein